MYEHLEIGIRFTAWQVRVALKDEKPKYVFHGHGRGITMKDPTVRHRATNPARTDHRVEYAFYVFDPHRGPLHAAVVWGVVAVALLLATNLVHSRVGRALQAIASDEASAAASGIPVASYKLRLFIVAAALAGLGGGMFTFSFLIVSPDAFPIVLSIEFVVMVAAGGLGNMYGAVAGAVAILYLEQKLRDLGAKPELFGWDLPDAAPTERLNRIVWGAVRGWDKAYPPVRQSLFAPLSIDIEDEDRDEDDR